MSDDSHERFRKVITEMLNVLIGAVERHYGSGPVSLAQLRAMAATAAVLPGYSTVIADLDEIVREEIFRQKREDPFNRLIVHPLSVAFREGTLSRDCLGNYFTFIHMVLGEQQEILSNRCNAIYQDLRQAQGNKFEWMMFYQDARAQQVLWAVLVRVAESFRRFDVRRQWFISLMQYTPQAMSLGSNAFVTRSHGEDKQAGSFGRSEFNAMFAALYAPFLSLSEDEYTRFTHDFGQPPEKVFGVLWQNLIASGAVL